MPQDPPSEPDPDDSDTEPEFVEVDPSGRYGRVRMFFTAHPIMLHLFFFIIRIIFDFVWNSRLQYAFGFCLFPNFLNFVLLSLFISRDGIFSLFFFFVQYKEVLGKGAFKKVYPFPDFLS